MKLTKEQIREVLQNKLNVMVDRLYPEDYVLDTKVDKEKCFEFVALELFGLKEYPSLNSNNGVRESVVLTLDDEVGVYSEFEAREKIDYTYKAAEQCGESIITTVKYYFGDGTEEEVNEGDTRTVWYPSNRIIPMKSK